MLCFYPIFLLLSSEQFVAGFFSFSQEYFLMIQGLNSALLGAKLTVVLLSGCGWYLGETEPAPREEERALGFESIQCTPYMNFLYSSTVNFLLSSIEVDISLLQHISSSTFLKDLTTQWARISSMVILLRGLNTNIFSRRSTQQGDISFHRAGLLMLGGIFISLIIDLETSDQMELMSSQVGQPVKAHIFQSCSRVQLPLKRGFCASISQMIHPKLHISAGVEQDFDPSSTQGERYQRVATPSVSTAEWSLVWFRERTSPKSQSLMVQLELTSTLDGFRSRWMTCAECRYLSALASWQTMKRMCTSLRMFSAITLWRSASMNSKRRYTSLLLSARMVYVSLMMFWWSNCRRIQISRQVRWASVACWKASKIFFRAEIFLVDFYSTFQTWPQAPEPTFLRMLKRRRMWPSMKVVQFCEAMQKQGFQFYIIIQGNASNAIPSLVLKLYFSGLFDNLKYQISFKMILIIMK